MIKTKEIIKSKKKFRAGKIIAFIIVIALVGTAFMASCGGGVKSGAPVMRSNHGGTVSTVSSNIFSYYLSFVKSSELYQYSSYFQMMGMGEIPDSPEIWNQEIPLDSGNPSIRTYGDVVRLQAVSQVQQLFAVELYCKDNNISLTKDEINEIDVAIKEMVRADFRNSKMNFNMTLARFGVNEQIFKQIKELERLYSVFTNYLLSPTTGIKPVSDTAIWDKFADEYVRVRHILIRTSTGELDEEGREIPFSDEELAEKLAKADDIYNKILSGEDFDDFYEESEDPGSASYPNGYCFPRNSGMIIEFEDAAFDMKIDEVRMVETDFGMHIMKKYELVVDDILEHEAQIIRDLETVVMEEELRPYLDSIEVIYDEVNEFNVVTVDTMLDEAAFPLIALTW